MNNWGHTNPLPELAMVTEPEPVANVAQMECDDTAGDLPSLTSMSWEHSAFPGHMRPVELATDNVSIIPAHSPAPLR